MRTSIALFVVVTAPACNGKRAGEPITFPDDCGSMGFQRIGGVSRCAQVGEHTQLGLKPADDEMLVTLGNHIVGTSFTVGDQTGNDDTPLVRVKLGEQVARLTIAQVKDEQPVDFHLTLTVDVPRRGESTAPVPPMKVGRAVVDMMRAAAERPLKLPGDTDAPAKHTVLFAADNAWEAEIDGPAKTVADIDWVAVAKRGDEKTVTSCTYTSDRGGFTVPVKGFDTTVVIYERRTHKVIDKMEAPAYAEECPSSATSGQYSFDAKNDYKPIKAWLATRITAS